MKETARVVIIGGGMMGCGLAYHLGDAGWDDVLLIEKGELTSGSTWHAAGQCPSLIGDYAMAQVHHASNLLYPRLEELTGQNPGWHGCGGIRLALSEAEVDWFHQMKGIARSVGYHMEVIGPDEIARHHPFLNTEGVLAGALTLDDGHVDPASACNALARGARNFGVSIVTKTRVTGIERAPGGEWLVQTDSGNLRCEHVVNAAGCYAGEVMKWVGARAPITNMQHQYIVTEPIPEIAARAGELPVVRDPWCSGYLRQEQNAGLIGIYETPARESWEARGGVPDWDSESELFDADIDRVAPFLERAFARMPILAEAGLKRVINGAIPHTPDGNPLVGRAAGLANFWMCCGSSIGIAQGGGVGKYLAQQIIHGDAEINMLSLDPRRFGPYADADYTRAKSFQDYHHMYAAHMPGEERPAGRPARTTPLYEVLNARGCIHTEGFGWERPRWFSPDGRAETPGFRRNETHAAVAEECRAVRERVGLMDLSSFAKFDISGRGAEAFLNRLYANRMPAEGRIALAHRLSEAGRIRGESTVTRLAGGRFYLLSGAAWELRDLDAFARARQPNEDVTIANVTDAFGVLVLAGPRAREVLAPLTGAGLSNAAFPWLSAREITVAGVPVRALRVNYLGALGWELHAPMERLAELYAALWQAGEAHGIADFGLLAVNALRMEKAYKGMGTELTPEITPVEADIMRFVKMDKDFTDRDALEHHEAMALRLVYGEIDARGADVRGGEPVRANGRVMGVATSGGYGHHVGKSLFFAYVAPEHAAPGSTFEIGVLDDWRPATVLAAPAFDPENAALRG